MDMKMKVALGMLKMKKLPKAVTENPEVQEKILTSIAKELHKKGQTLSYENREAIMKVLRGEEKPSYLMEALRG